MHAKPDLRVVLEWKIAGSGSVIADVTSTNREFASAMIHTTRLRIAHLLVVTTAVALMTAWWQLCNTLQYSNSPEPPPRFDPIRQLTWALVQGSLLASLLFLWLNGRQVHQWLYHPGHWILLLNAVPVPIILVVHTIRSVQLSWYGEKNTNWIAYAYPDLVYCAVDLAISAFWMFAIWRLRNQMAKAWTIVFGLYLGIAVTTAFGHAIHAAGAPNPIYGAVLTLQFLVLATLLIASVRDAIAKTQRDWLHWFAIAVTLVAFLGNPVIEFVAEANSAT